MANETNVRALIAHIGPYVTFYDKHDDNDGNYLIFGATGAGRGNESHQN